MTYILNETIIAAIEANNASMHRQAIVDHTTLNTMGCDLEHAPYQLSDVLPLLAVRFADKDMYEDACADLPTGSYLINNIDQDMLMTPETIAEFEGELSNYAYGLYLPSSDMLVKVV